MNLRLTIWLLMLLTVPVLADGPADNVPDSVRPVPPVGIEVPAAKQQELLAAAAELDAEIAKVAKTSPQDRAEVAVFARAVRMAVEDGMFYTDKEIAQAENLIKLGQTRLAALTAGKTGAELIGAQSQPSSKPQLVVGGFQSRIDGSIQPYGLVLPAETELVPSRPRRLDVWLHGRGEKSSEAAFLNGRLNSVGEIAPPETIVLHPYGRYCNAFKFAGEVDVLEAIAHVQRLFAIDDDRINIRGFSMGGAGCWQMAVHYPGMWMAATPGAGFSETRQFLKVFQKEDFQPTPTQLPLLHWYDCPDWSDNLRLLPTVAYSGEIDSQKQAADVMEAAMKDRGLKLKHIIGPQTGHKIHPDSKIEIEKFLSDVSVKGRQATPTEIDFTTYTLRYAENAWLKIEGMEKHWQAARVQAKVLSPTAMSIKTQNVTRLALLFPIDQHILSRTEAIKVDLQTLGEASTPGTTLTLRVAADQPLRALLEKKATGWQVVSQFEGLRKQPGLQGPIDDAFMDAFVFLGPETKGSTAQPVDTWIDSEYQHAKREWRRHFRGDIPERTTSTLTEADVAEKNLVLFGTPQSNPTLAKIVAQLPIVWNDQQVSVGGATQGAGEHVPVLIYPNPLNPSRYVVINSGFTYREFAYLNNARQIAMLPDWAIVSAKTGRNYQVPGTIVAAGFFNEQWK